MGARGTPICIPCGSSALVKTRSNAPSAEHLVGLRLRRTQTTLIRVCHRNSATLISLWEGQGPPRPSSPHDASRGCAPGREHPYACHTLGEFGDRYSGSRTES
jgi:hypothetical protein